MIDRVSKNEYSHWLSKQELSNLIKLTESKELDNDSSSMAIKYLNEQHQGWSMA
jgi:hypothetical protein